MGRPAHPPRSTPTDIQGRSESSLPHRLRRPADSLYPPATQANSILAPVNRPDYRALDPQGSLLRSRLPGRRSCGGWCKSAANREPLQVRALSELGFHVPFQEEPGRALPIPLKFPHSWAIHALQEPAEATSEMGASRGTRTNRRAFAGYAAPVRSSLEPRFPPQGSRPGGAPPASR